MSSVFSALCVAAAASIALSAAAPAPLRVCSDPNNLPFSNQQGDGFENKIAELIARDLHRPLEYFWTPQRRGFIRNTLTANRCDVVMGVPAHFDRARTTRPYYKSAYAFISRRSRALDVRSFDDVRLKTLLVGIQITGDDYENPPAAQALASRHIIDNVRGYTVYGDYSKPDPQREIVDAVAAGKIDLAVVWGPIGGYFARHEPVPMSVVPVKAPDAGAMRFAFEIAMGVRRDDASLQQALDAFIVRRRTDVRRILAAYGVPLV